MSDPKVRMSGRPAPPPAEPAPRRGAAAWYLLLLIPFVALLWPASYAHARPMLWGVPFFYWYQFLWLILGAVLTQVVFNATRRGAAR